jgi:hypothetical protein
MFVEVNEEQDDTRIDCATCKCCVPRSPRQEEASAADQETRHKVAVRRRNDWMEQDGKEVGLFQSLDIGGLE